MPTQQESWFRYPGQRIQGLIQWLFKVFDVSKPSAFTASVPKHQAQIKDHGRVHGKDQRHGRARLRYGTPK